MDAIKEGMLASAKAAEAAARIGERLFCQNTQSVMNFKSQICTSREQSQRLLALGLKPETADMVWIPEVDFNAEGEPYDTGEYFERPIQGVWDYTLLEGIPAWSLHRLIEMLNKSGVTISFVERDTSIIVERYGVFQNVCEIWDNVYDNICDTDEWLIKEGYFNKEYLV